MSTQKHVLTETLEAIRDHSEGETISFEDLVEALNHRGFGPLLIAPALITVLPTGAIPGIPALCALFIILIAVQIIMGRSYPWIPQRLKTISFDRDQYTKALKKAHPYTTWIDGFFHPRLQFLTNETSQKIIAFLCIGLSIGIIALGFIPFAPMLPAATILFFGLGLSVHDGLLTACGFLLMVLAILALPVLF